MAKYLSLDGLTQYDELIKVKIEELDAATLASAKADAASKDAVVLAEVQKSIAAVQQNIDGKANSNHNHDDAYDAKGAAATAEGNAKAYADGIKEALLGGAGDAYDTLKELADLIGSHEESVDDALEALTQVAASKVSTDSDASLKSLNVTTNLTVAGDISASNLEVDAGGTLVVDGYNIVEEIDALDGRLDNLATVATSGSYDDLKNKPTIPTKVSDLTNDKKFIEAESDATLNSLVIASTSEEFGIEIDAGGTLIVNGVNVETSINDLYTNKADKTTVQGLATSVSNNATEIGKHAGYISTLQTAFESITAITSDEISALFA